MKTYLRQRADNRRASNAVGVILTLGLHAAVLLACSYAGLNYLDPPPQEDSFVLDFSEEEEEVKEIRRGKVQKDISPYESKAENLTPETKRDDFGDVETPAPEPRKEPELDARASFPGMARKDTTLTAPHSSPEAGDKFRAGEGASLEGRSVEGAIARPVYDIQESGTVVVTIWVDNYGTVKNARAGAEGTTVTNNKLWQAAREAALKTKFSMSADAPALQQGTITYIFKLK